MDGPRLLLLTRLRDHSPSSVDALADALKLHWADAYHTLERMLGDRLVEQHGDPNAEEYAITEVGRKTLEVLDSVRAGPPGWRQGKLW
jgi:predicted transcriptional regulator